MNSNPVVNPRQVMVSQNNAELESQLKGLKDQKQKAELTQKYIFARNSEVLDAHGELRDQLRRADGIV